MHAYVTGELFKRKNRDFYDFLGHLGDVFLKFRDSNISKMTIFVHFWQEIVKKNAKKIETSKNEHKAPRSYAIWDRFTMRTSISPMRHFEATYFDFRIFWWDLDVIKRWRIIDAVNIPNNVKKNLERNHLAFGKRTYRVGASLCAIKQQKWWQILRERSKLLMRGYNSRCQKYTSKIDKFSISNISIFEVLKSRIRRNMNLKWPKNHHSACFLHINNSQNT